LLKLQIWFGDMLWISQAMKVFDDQGQMIDDKIRNKITKYMEGFYEFIRP
jgi:hypothetical protein